MTLESRCAQGGLDPVSRRAWSSVDVQHSGSEEALVQALQRCRRVLQSLSHDVASFAWSAAAFTSACARCAPTHKKHDDESQSGSEQRSGSSGKGQ